MTWKDSLPMETLAKERENPPFDLDAMKIANHGSQERLEFKRRVMLELERNKAFYNDDFYDLTKDELRVRTFIKIGSIVNWLLTENLDVFRQRLEVISVADPGFWTRFGVHLGLFTNCVRSGSTSGQFAYWVNQGMLACKEFYGCFGMTELAHGSNVQGIETTATFDENTDEFIIHTPNLGATKWWIGGAAHSATHCAVFARLIVHGKDYGTKTFVVQLRNLDTYETLPGVTIGDIGKKMGRDGIDNGYIQFTYVRVPRAHMLMRHCQVTRDGQVTEPPMQQLAYGALLTGRVMMAVDSSNIGKKAITIAGRYAAVRRQFKSDPNSKYETQLLDYPIHQRRLMPLLAQAIAFQYCGQQLTHMLEQTTSALDALEPGDPKLQDVIELLKSTHASSSGLKAFCTWGTLSAIEVCRQSLGGHGYSSYTGLAPLYNDFAVHCTWEGDNTILALQLGRALMSAYEESRQGKKQGEALAYLNDIEATLRARCSSEQELNSLAGIEAGWLTASAHFVKVAYDEFQRLIKTGNSREAAAEKCSQLRFVAASVHTTGFIFRQFRAAVEELPEKSDGVKATLTKVALLYGLWQMEEKAGFLLRSGWLKPEQCDFLTVRVSELCAEVRSFAIPLIDSFEYSDFVINSPFGRYDGNVYREYFDMIRRNNPPLKPHPYFETLVKPLISRKTREVDNVGELMNLDEEIEEIQAETSEALKAAKKA
ncbi:acyl-CoA oxidase [Malassezia nana]|uniref:Acyl-coenzyme A oxidase n=1 Tax=Malassezia nana TaxID=180528 RepID=A0AAF0EP97_9BASI|nr:acyl-CoA oxidase [Malassezia nana]